MTKANMECSYLSHQPDQFAITKSANWLNSAPDFRKKMGGGGGGEKGERTTCKLSNFLSSKAT